MRDFNEGALTPAFFTEERDGSVVQGEHLEDPRGVAKRRRPGRRTGARQDDEPFGEACLGERDGLGGGVGVEASLNGLVALLLGAALSFARGREFVTQFLELVLELLGELGGGYHVAGEA